MLRGHEIVASYPHRSERALDRVSFEVGAGRTLCIVGPSGAGKSTLLRIVAGLLHPQGGDVSIDGVSLLGEPPQRRRVALVFQDDALLPHATVRENLRLAVRGRRDGKDARVEETARALHVAEHLDRRPRRLSGGERQRASIARALLSDPRALLLDEPLAHLDPSLRRSIRDEVLGVRQRFAGPIVYVTHDHVEAMTVGDRLAVLVDGRIEDVGEPARVYDAPRTTAVARFLGERPMNLLAADGYLLGIRPEFVRIEQSGAWRGRIVRREVTGADAYLDVETARGNVVVRVPAAQAQRCGDFVALDLPAQFLRRFDPGDGVAIA